MTRAAAWLDASFSSVETSGVYSTQALNGTSPDYLNMVAAVETDMTAERLAAFGKEFERECGRTPDSKITGIVEMDVDLIQFGRVILRPQEFLRRYFTEGCKKLRLNGN